jgi:CBS domain containing-hemolysin-like protein
LEISLTIALPLFLAAAAASFFFALAESALFSLGRWRAVRLAETDARRGGAVVRLLDRSSELLATLVLGNSMANTLLVVLGLLTATAGGWPTVLVVFGVLAVTLLICEVTPKALGVRQPDRWSLTVAPILGLLMAVTGPVHRAAQRLVDTILNWFIPASLKPQPALSDEEYADLVELAHQQGTLADAEREILLQVLGLDRRTARDVMRPRSDMVMLPDDAPIEEMTRVARQSRRHRLPLYDETPDTIVGILNTRTLLLNPEGDLADAVEFPSFVPESMNLLQLFEALQRQQRGMAIVMDEFGGVAGMVTLEDILEQVVGRIRREGEPAGFVSERLGEGRWRVNGTMRLEDLRRQLPELGEVDEVDTVGGLVIKLAEVVPPVGAEFHFRKIRLTVLEADHRRVREVRVEASMKGGGQ